MPRLIGGWCAIALVVGFWSSPLSADNAQAVERLTVEAPGVRTLCQGEAVTRAFGRPMSFGGDALESCERFRAQHAAAFGALPEDLSLAGLSPDGPALQPLMYDAETGEYRFTLARYAQARDGVPVYGADLRVLVRNEPDHPVVLAASALRDLGTFQVGVRKQGLTFDPATDATTGMSNFTAPETVIWAGLGEARVQPKLAVTFIGDNYDDPEADTLERWRFVCDAATGEILHQENLIIFTDVSGSVQGMATMGPKADFCTDETLEDLPYARVAISGGSTAYTDASGAFTIPNGGTSSVTVSSYVDGLYFDVDHYTGTEETLSMSVAPPGPADFVHNQANTDELVRAQTNGYVHPNIVREWVLTYNPSYPTISTQTNFPVRVNRTDFYCPGNAWYDGTSLNFCQTGSGYPNTAWSSVVYHEYGHHVVEMGGSGQDAYGEGMSDCISMLILDDPILGYGFFGDCDSGLRTADNTCQYLASGCSTCGSEGHDCGQLLSGIVWDIREELAVTEPFGALAIISSLCVNSVPMHSGTSIAADIAIDFLTLDDDDGNLDNGTPHYDEICTGFEMHGIDCPDIQQGLSVSPAQDFVSEGPNGGPFSPASKAYTLENLGPGSLEYNVTKTANWITVTNGSGTLANVGDTAIVTVSINGEALSLADGAYEGTVTFVNRTDHVGDTTRQVSLTVGVPVPVYEWTLDTNPGWTTQGGWAYGQPQGGYGDQGGADPTSAYTGTNVYGYRLGAGSAGGYEDNMSEMHLTSTAVDCTDYEACTLRFRRWLAVESSQYDHAYVRVSNNGSNWTTVWQNGSTTLEDSSWVLQEFDISAVADGQSTVYLRWTMGETDGGWTYGGWNIDDIQIVALGGEPPALSLLLPDGVPGSLIPGEATTFRVQVVDGAEQYADGTGMLHYRYDGGIWQTSSLVLESGNVYQATLPAAGCAATPEFYVTAAGDGGTTVSSPSSAPATVYEASVGVLTVILDEDFETDQGWTTSSQNASSGQWSRGVPVNDSGWDYDPYSDGDGSGQAYLTQNEVGNTDIDAATGYSNGIVRLMSPTMDLSGGGVSISYDYYLYLTQAVQNNDVLLVEISTNGDAGPWTQIARHNTDGGTSWRDHAISQAELDAAGVTLTDNCKLRFSANDADDQSINEAGLDGLLVTAFECSVNPGDGDFDADADVDLVDYQAFQACFDLGFVPAGCEDGDLDGDTDVDRDDFALFFDALSVPN